MCIRDSLGVGQVGSDAHVNVLALLEEAELGRVGQISHVLDLVVLLALLHQLHSLVTVSYTHLSDDPIQRAQLSTFRSIGSMGGALLTGMLIPVIIYDNQNTLRGEQMLSLIHI